MQPYFFPYIGYWQLIQAVDTFVVYNNIQFTKKGWFHRNNILLNGGKKLFTLPLKKDSDYLDVQDRKLAPSSETQINKILRQIQAGYSKASYFSDVYPIIEDIFLFNDKNLFNYILNSIIKVSGFLELDTKIIKSSNIDINHNLKSQEKVIAICKELKADLYVNSIGGKNLYDKSQFASEHIFLKFLKSKIPTYKQFENKFIPSLSIMDIMMFNSKNDIKKMLTEYQLL